MQIVNRFSWQNIGETLRCSEKFDEICPKLDEIWENLTKSGEIYLNSEKFDEILFDFFYPKFTRG